MAHPPDSSRAQDGAPDGIRPPAVLQPDKVVASRKGDVLIKYTILKSDHFPGVQWPDSSRLIMIEMKAHFLFPARTSYPWPRAGCQNKKLLPLLEGAPNFRQVHFSFAIHLLLRCFYLRTSSWIRLSAGAGAACVWSGHPDRVWPAPRSGRARSRARQAPLPILPQHCLDLACMADKPLSHLALL